MTIQTVLAELETGMTLPKCQKCGCMDSTLRGLVEAQPDNGAVDAHVLRRSLSTWLEQMRPVQYSCLGCEHCYPAVAQNAFNQAFPALGLEVVDLSCQFSVSDRSWPLVVGEYVVLNVNASVAVSTLASTSLPAEIARRNPAGLAIAGKTETENIGIDKVVKNVITNPAIRYLIVAGREPQGHLSGETLLSLFENGVDEKGRVIESRGKRPILRNVSAAEIRAFREQIQVIDMRGCDSPDEIATQIEELSQKSGASCGCSECCAEAPVFLSAAPRVTTAEVVAAPKLDRAGYFVIVPLVGRGVISVEHYAYDNSLLRTIEGLSARAIYSTIIEQGWVTELSHAAYLGKELEKAELSLQLDFKFVQDGA